MADIFKTGLLHQYKLISTGDRAAYSLRPGFDASGKMRRQFLFQDDIDKLQAAARFQHPENLRKKSGFVGREVDNPIGDYDIEKVVDKWQPLRRNKDYLSIFHPHAGKIGPGPGDHFRGKIDTVDPACLLDQAGGDGKI